MQSQIHSIGAYDQGALTGCGLHEIHLFMISTGRANSNFKCQHFLVNQPFMHHLECRVSSSPIILGSLQ